MIMKMLLLGADSQFIATCKIPESRQTTTHLPEIGILILVFCNWFKDKNQVQYIQQLPSFLFIKGQISNTTKAALLVIMVITYCHVPTISLKKI